MQREAEERTGTSKYEKTGSRAEPSSRGIIPVLYHELVIFPNSHRFLYTDQ